jgi:hypothetical protein
MNFSVGLIDGLFGKRITLEVPCPDGSVVQRQVTQKWFDRMVAEKKISPASQDSVLVCMIGPYGESRQTWIVGRDIDEKTVEEWADKQTNTIYVGTRYREGKAEYYYMRKPYWDQMKKLLESV